MTVDESGWKWLKVDKSGWKGVKERSEWNGDDSGWKWMKLDERGQYRIRVYDSGWRWMKVKISGWNWIKLGKVGGRRWKYKKEDENEWKWIKFNESGPPWTPEHQGDFRKRVEPNAIWGYRNSVRFLPNTGWIGKKQPWQTQRSRQNLAKPNKSNICSKSTFSYIFGYSMKKCHISFLFVNGVLFDTNS